MVIMMVVTIAVGLDCPHEHSIERSIEHPIEYSMEHSIERSIEHAVTIAVGLDGLHNHCYDCCCGGYYNTQVLRMLDGLRMVMGAKIAASASRPV